MANWTIRRATLGDDPEENFIDKDRMIVKVPLAENHNRRVFNEQTKKYEWEQKSTSWYHAAIFGDPNDNNSLVNQLLELRKGDMIRVIEGTMEQHSWEDKEGNTRYDWNFVIKDFKQIWPQDYPDDRENN